MLTNFFLRYLRIFNKSKYSRVRQWTKTIVFFGVWFNLASIYFLYYHSYTYTFIILYPFFILNVLFIFCLYQLLDQMHLFYLNFIPFYSVFIKNTIICFSK